MSRLRKRIALLLPNGFLKRITFLNSSILALTILISGWAVYRSACVLVADMDGLDVQKQQMFNAALFQYVLAIFVVFIIVSTLLHYYSTKRLLKPLRELIQSTKQLKRGKLPEQVNVRGQDEMSQLVKQYNELIDQLYTNEQLRKKQITDVSHEIRTPLSNISGYLQALEGGKIEGNPQLFYSLFQESRRLTQLLDQLEQLKEWDHLSAQTIMELKDTEMKELVEQCIALFKLSMEQRGIECEVDIAPCVLAVHEEGMQQVISNIIDNAITYYEGTGPLKVKGERIGTSYRISVAGPSRNIDDHEKKHLFKRFYRLDTARSRETGGGTGLGLAITKEIVQSHGGEIGLETSPGHNQFWFKLPLDR